MQELGELCCEMGLEIQVTAKTMEDYMSFWIRIPMAKDREL